MEFVRFMVDYSTNFIATGGLLYGFLIVLIECFIPILPLGVFVALNVNAFGAVIGIIISWLATTLGSFLVYLLFSFLEKKVVSKFVNKKTVKRIMKGVNKFKNIKLPELVLLITLPFTPAFLINILAGLARVPKKKFVIALLIGKIFSVTFWGFIGKSLIESLTDIVSIVFIVITLMIAYIISKIVSRKMNIE